MAQLDKTFPTGDCAMCILSPKLVECARNRNIEIITLADIQDVSGQPGRFKVKIRQNPRYVDIKKCEVCGDCAAVCPVNLPSEFDRGLSSRKAIYQLYPQAIPSAYSISKASGTAPCKAACPAGINVPGAVALISAGKISEAYELIRQRCPIPASCGRVCPHPCQNHCNRAAVDEAVYFRPPGTVCRRLHSFESCPGVFACARFIGRKSRRHRRRSGRIDRGNRSDADGVWCDAV